MGTSTSSGGGKAGSPFDPEWLVGDGDDAGEAVDNAEVSNGDEGETTGDKVGDNFESCPPYEASASALGETEFAPDRRFADARTKMSAYLSGGGRESLRSATKSMVNKGMGGPRRAASTMRGAAQGAGRLGQFLVATRDGIESKVRDWVERVRALNLSASDLALELVKEVLPDTGSVDDESLRNAAADALGKLYESDPNVDIFSLTDQQIADVIAFTIANEVCNRMDMQLGQTYERLKFNPHEVQLYRNDMKEYVHAEVRVVMAQHSTANLDPQRLSREVLASAFMVFAE